MRSSTDADRLALVDLLQAGFVRAAGAVNETSDCFFQIGDHRIRVRFAGTELQTRLAPALAHLAADGTAEPDLTVYVWDSDSTHTPLPLLAESLIRLIRLRWFEELNGRREI